MAKIYIGKAEHPNVYKIGFTEQTCWARCKKADYHIFAAGDFIDIDNSEMLFLESYVRMCFNQMAEVDYQLRADYFHISPAFQTTITEEWLQKWLFTFLEEGRIILNQKRKYTQTPFIERVYKHIGYVYPYSY